MRPKYLVDDEDIRYSAVIPDYQTWTVSVETLATAEPRGLAVRLGREELVRGGAVLAVIPRASENQYCLSELYY